MSTIYDQAAREGLAQGITDPAELSAYVLQRVQEAKAAGHVSLDDAAPAPTSKPKPMAAESETPKAPTSELGIVEARRMVMTAHPELSSDAIENAAQGLVAKAGRLAALDAISASVAEAETKDGDVWSHLFPEREARTEALVADLEERSKREAERIVEQTPAKIEGWNY